MLTEFDNNILKWITPITNWLNIKIADRATCEDIVSDAIVAMYRNKSTYKETGNFKTWFWTIVKNYLKLRYADKTRKYVEIKDTDFIRRSEYKVSLNQKKMKLVFDLLPLQQQKVLTGLFENGWTQKEVAEAIGVAHRELVQDYKDAAIKNVKTLWKVFDSFTNEEINSLTKLELLSPTQMAKECGVCDDTLLKLIKCGNVPHIRYGGNNGFKVERRCFNEFKNSDLWKMRKTRNRKV